jgi:hypothetical protein
MTTYTKSNFSHSLLDTARNSLAELVIQELGSSTAYNANSMAKLCENDKIRGKIYDTAPCLSPIIGLCNSGEVRHQLESISKHPADSFCCVNINVRIDFGDVRLQKKHNLGLHQDFHYANTFVTPKNSFVLWAPIECLSSKVGGIGFVRDLADIEGALVHVAQQRGTNRAPHWLVGTDPSGLSIEHIKFSLGEFLLFDMRHLHCSVPNEDPIFPRITLQARYSSYCEPGFREYYKALPKD